MNTKTNTDTNKAPDPGRETPPRTVTVELPGECPEGLQWVAAFRQPLPMMAMSKLCTALAEAYGADANILPQGDWVAVAGTLCTDDDGNSRPLKRAWRICEVMPDSADDGGTFTATSPEEAARMMVKRHPGVMDYETLYAWPDGEAPGPDNLLGIATKALAFAEAVVNPPGLTPEQLEAANPDPVFQADDRGNVVDFYDEEGEEVGRIDREAEVDGKIDQTTFEAFHSRDALVHWMNANGYAEELKECREI